MAYTGAPGRKASGYFANRFGTPEVNYSAALEAFSAVCVLQLAEEKKGERRRELVPPVRCFVKQQRDSSSSRSRSSRSR